ncbi:glycosyltransferase [Novosphingobium malaysiense]|uniref:Group 1 glycosyl transferase n=1 Tax=Novosphingobium malaysiense TaxID=1348853 RepID=A0A0B1ZP11_9SPHN|nr:glycosyltransferase [Novosphingobium malaysiense]KHK92321.1 group 1 glycosyl transferase [Novosphingobium malaysiense]
MPEPLRIAIPIHSFEPGGVERVALNLARSWHAAGHHVRVVLGRDQGADRSRAPADLDYRSVPTRFSTAPFETLWMMWCLLRHLLCEETDVIFCAGNTYAVVCVTMRLLLRRRCPPVVVKISNDLLRRDLPPGYRHLYYLWLRVQGLLLDHFVALAEPMRAEIVDTLGVAANRVTTIHDPALTATRYAALLSIPRTGPDRSERGLRFLAVGRLARQKNLPLLVTAFARGSNRQDTLTIVGEGPERGKLEALVGSLSLHGRVFLTGHAVDPDPYFREADVFVLSSDYEGVPAVVIEAIAAGLPVLATDCAASMQALLGGGIRGQLVPVGDDTALAAAMNGADLLRFPDQSARVFAERFTVEIAARAYVAAMRALQAEARAEDAGSLIPAVRGSDC